MRKRLKRLGAEKRYTFIARVTKYSFKRGFINNLPLKTILLTKVMCNGEPVADHVWMNCGRRFCSLLPQVRQWLQFNARITKYHRKDGTEDYKLSYPSKVSFLHKTPCKRAWNTKMKEMGIGQHDKEKLIRVLSN